MSAMERTSEASRVKLSARPSRPRLRDRRRENPLRTLRNATTARYTDASDASEEVSARVVVASVCVCF